MMQFLPTVKVGKLYQLCFRGRRQARSWTTCSLRGLHDCALAFFILDFFHLFSGLPASWLPAAV